jgi:hypothetical protein
MRNPSSIAHAAGNSEPQAPVRLAAFARFFKAYMGTASVVTAALPVPVAALHLIPTYAAQGKFLSTYTSLFCFLMLAYLFYIRHWLGRLMFSTRPDGHVVLRSFLAFVPLVLILSSLGLVALYHYYLTQSLQVFTQQGVTNSTTDILKSVDYREIPYSLQLTACYLGMFLAAESAFILMALREYLQDVLHIPDASLLRLQRPRSHKRDEVMLTPVQDAEKVRHAGSSSAS